MSRLIYFLLGVSILIGLGIGVFLWNSKKSEIERLSTRTQLDKTSDTSAHAQVEQASAQAQGPLWRMIGWMQRKQEAAADSLARIDALEEEGRRLRSENTLLSTKMAQFASLEAENIRLKEALEFKKQSPFRLLACHVVSRDLATWSSMVIIDRGWADDEALAQDQPVVTPRGVVGKTGVVGRHTTKVVLLTDPNCKISVEVEGTRAKGVVVGTSEVGHVGELCKISYVARETELAPHARVFTSGLGGVFPQGLLIGIIRNAPPLSSNRNFGLFRDGTVEPIVDLDGLREVFVILGEK